MLPPELSEDAARACGRTRPALRHDRRAAAGAASRRFYRSIIRSDARLSYGQVERIAEAEPELAGGARARRCASSAELRARGSRRGALRIETPELEFAFDGEGGVARAWFQSEPRAHALVEDLMILRNEAVAELLAERGREALYRVHERPDPQSISLL